MSMPRKPKIYHIVHVDRLPSILQDGFLWSDAETQRHDSSGTSIGMDGIKKRRLNELKLTSHPGLRVGDCVPFYFCPRSIMLYLIYQGNHPGLTYHGGQNHIIHLEADLYKSVDWAVKNQKRWAFTLSNAGASFFEDRCDLSRLPEIDWIAVQATDWRGHKDGKQAEFLMEECFPWQLVERIGVHSSKICQRVTGVLATGCRICVTIESNWYY